MKSNLVALFIAAILCVSLLCGCTTRTPVADPGATDGTESTTADSDATDTVSPQTEPAVTDTTETTPPETEPNTTEPLQTEPTETESNVTEPQETEPAETETNDDPPREEVIPESIVTELTDDGYVVYYTPESHPIKPYILARTCPNNRFFPHMPYELLKHFRETEEEVFYTQICNNGVFRIRFDGDAYLQSVTHGDVTYTYPEDRLCSGGYSEFYAFEADGLFIMEDCYEHILIFTDTEVIRISPWDQISDDPADACILRFYLGEDGHLHYARIIALLVFADNVFNYESYYLSEDQYYAEDGIVTLSDGQLIYQREHYYSLSDAGIGFDSITPSYLSIKSKDELANANRARREIRSKLKEIFTEFGIKTAYFDTETIDQETADALTTKIQEVFGVTNKIHAGSCDLISLSYYIYREQNET